eukprot:900592-Amphidinium_carterae.1
MQEQGLQEEASEEVDMQDSLEKEPDLKEQEGSPMKEEKVDMQDSLEKEQEVGSPMQDEGLQKEADMQDSLEKGPELKEEVDSLMQEQGLQEAGGKPSSGVFSTGRQDCLKNGCAIDLSRRAFGVQRIRSGCFPDGNVKCQVIQGSALAVPGMPRFWKVSCRSSRQLNKKRLPRLKYHPTVTRRPKIFL